MSLISAEQLNTKLDPKLWPTFSSVTEQEHSVHLCLYVPEGLSYFAGHFPTQAVLPGVVQVHWAGELGRLLFNVEGFSELKSVKFNSMILPRHNVELELKVSHERESLRFQYSGNDLSAGNRQIKFSNGSMVFENGVA